MPIKDYSTDPDLNVQISGINIAEGCPPSGINNAIRQLMADVKVESEAKAEAITAASSALEAYAEEQALIDAAQDTKIAEAQSSADAASEDVTELDATLRQLIAEELAKRLPLSGGTMTGRLKVPSRLDIIRSEFDSEGSELFLQGVNAATVDFGIDNNKGKLRFIQYASPDGSVSGPSVVSFDFLNNIFIWKDIERDPKHMGFPLSKRIEVTASNNTTYTAPANGFFTLAATGNQGASSFVSLENTSATIGNHASGSGSLFVTIPMKKGDVVRMTYAQITSWFYCRFVYGG